MSCWGAKNLSLRSSNNKSCRPIGKKMSILKASDSPKFCRPPAVGDAHGAVFCGDELQRARGDVLLLLPGRPARGTSGSQTFGELRKKAQKNTLFFLVQKNIN